MGLMVGNEDRGTVARDVASPPDAKPPQQPKHESDKPRYEGEPKQQPTG
jgi:hypothetical protein